MIFQAHKGVSTENPENTMPAFVTAFEQGYKTAELDVAVTKDNKFVLLHDATVNRTARLKNGNEIQETIRINKITYKEALEYDFGIWFSKKFAGTKIALLENVLVFAKKNGMKLKIDNKYQSLGNEQKKLFFELLKKYENTACLTCSDIKELRYASGIFADMDFHYDGTVNEHTLSEISGFIPKNRLTVWLPMKNPDTSWVKVNFADAALCALVKRYAKLGLWILSDFSQAENAKALGADIIETNGRLKPNMNIGMLADMHTHSENSHDSVCKIEDMCNSQKKRGTSVFAVTDHFDTASFNDYDIFSPISSSCKTVAEIKKKQGNLLVLSGIEISEGFWYPNIYEKAINLEKYDAVIGSVHLVRYKNLSYAYSKIDFSALDKETISAYTNAYFNDMLEMTETADFDILAHLTCPLRYINGKYKIKTDLSRYNDKIEEILRRIIRMGISLEVNTSSFDVLNDFMPPSDILKKYYSMGGYLITLGSDAHTAENASAHFDKALNKLKEIGFKNIFYYKNRKPHQITI